MREIKEMLRLRYEAKLSNRAIARIRSISKEPAREYLCRSSKADLSWPLTGMIFMPIIFSYFDQ